jgi:hypothetical protein
MVANRTLGDFTLVVREQEVHTPTMNIELFAQIFGAHGGALNVPAREAFTPGTFPSHDMLRRCSFP